MKLELNYNVYMKSSTSPSSHFRKLPPTPCDDGDPAVSLVILTSPASILKPPLHVTSVNISDRVLAREGGDPPFLRPSLVTPLLPLLWLLMALWCARNPTKGSTPVPDMMRIKGRSGEGGM